MENLMVKWFARTTFFLAVMFASQGTGAADPYEAFSALRIEKMLAPDFSLPQVGGKRVRLSDYKGGAVLVGFFKTF